MFLPAEHTDDPSRDNVRVAVNGTWSRWLDGMSFLFLSLVHQLSAEVLTSADCTCDDPGHVCDYHDLVP